MPPTPPPTQSALMVCSIANVGLPVLRVSEISTLIGRSTCILLGNFSEENLLILSVFLFHSVLVSWEKCRGPPFWPQARKICSRLESGGLGLTWRLLVIDYCKKLRLFWEVTGSYLLELLETSFTLTQAGWHRRTEISLPEDSHHPFSMLPKMPLHLSGCTIRVC